MIILASQGTIAALLVKASDSSFSLSAGSILCNSPFIPYCFLKIGHVCLPSVQFFRLHLSFLVYFTPSKRTQNSIPDALDPKQFLIAQSYKETEEDCALLHPPSHSSSIPKAREGNMVQRLIVSQNSVKLFLCLISI